MHRFAIRPLFLCVSLALCALSSSAWTQSEPGEDDTWLEEGEGEGAAAPASEADALYQGGLDAIDQGDYALAKRKFERFLELYPDDPRGESVKRLMAASKDASGKGKKRSETLSSPEKASSNTGSSSAAVEMIGLATAWGVFTGIVIGVETESFSTGLVTASIGGIVGMLGTVLYSWSNPITPAQASLFSTGILGGVWHAIAISAVTDSWGEHSLWATWGVATAGGIAALVTGALFEIDDGDMALANSGALWGTFLMGMFTIMGGDDIEPGTIFGLLLLGTDLGFVGAAVASVYVDTSRERMAMIDLGGALGGLMGLGIMLAVDPSRSDGQTSVPLVLIATTGAGLALTAFLTRNMDRETITLSENLPLPSPFLVPQFDGQGRLGFAAGIQLLGTTF